MVPVAAFCILLSAGAEACLIKERKRRKDMPVKVPGMKQAKRLFERDFSDVIALVEGGTPEVYKKFRAELVAHAKLGETIDKYVMVHLATPASVDEKMYNEMVDEIYRVFCVLFVRLRDRNAFRFAAARMSPEAEAQFIRMEGIAGVRQRPPALADSPDRFVLNLRRLSP